MIAFKDGSLSLASLNHLSAALPKQHEIVLSPR
jgi:hypothetical protein